MVNRLLSILATIAVFSALMHAQSGTTQSGAAQSGPAKADPAKPKVLDALQGTWVLTTADGQDLSTGPEVAVTITGDKYVQTVNGDIVERGQIKLDETKKPVYIDLAIQEGNDAGKTQMGVIEVSGDTVKGKLNSPGDNVRPNDFEPADGFFAFTAVKKK
jgi:uncharacterized protein (TIGR03067 family)